MITCRDLVKTYASGDTQTSVLKGISFEVSTGELVAIMGPSGSGKSTLMHMLGCLDTPSSGTYFLDGHATSAYSDDELADIRMKKIGFVFQAFNLLPRSSVMRNVTLPLMYAGMPKEKRISRGTAALAEAAFPEGFWGYLSNQLSGGMMQRVAIARALVNDPTLVLADEPTGNLDTKTGEIVLDTFQRLHRDHGRTIILITHEPYVAEHAERIIHIRDGEIIKDEKNKNRRVIHNRL